MRRVYLNSVVRQEGLWMDGRLSIARIFVWFGVRQHDADLELVACDRCGQHSLVDHEHLRVFPDPADPRVVVLNIAGSPWPACRGGGAPNWDFVPAPVVTPEWRWAAEDAQPDAAAGPASQIVPEAWLPGELPSRCVRRGRTRNMAVLVHEVWETVCDGMILHACCLAGPRGEGCRRNLEQGGQAPGDFRGR
jgi:hypothetical protein